MPSKYRHHDAITFLSYTILPLLSFPPSLFLSFPSILPSTFAFLLYPFLLASLSYFLPFLLSPLSYPSFLPFFFAFHLFPLFPPFLPSYLHFFFFSPFLLNFIPVSTASRSPNLLFIRYLPLLSHPFPTLFFNRVYLLKTLHSVCLV